MELSHFTHIVFCTDGSHGKMYEDIWRNATWSLTVYYHDCSTDKYQFVGYMTGPVPASPELIDYIGASRPTNNAAELSAIVWGMLYYLQTPLKTDRPELHIKFVSDSQWSIGTIEQFWDGISHPMLIALAQNLYIAIQTCTCNKVTFKHVYGHSEDPQNELADTLCLLHQIDKVHSHADLATQLRVAMPAQPYLNNQQL